MTSSLEPLPSYQTHIRALDSTRADVRIFFVDLSPEVEVRGRLMGPRCPGVSTIEVAYPLRHVRGAEYQVLIPEPNLWAPEHPFRYEGPVEFWRGGEAVGRINVSVGLRMEKA